MSTNKLTSGIIIVPVYNEDPLVLQRTVGGLLGKSYSVLVVDDGSTPPVQLNFKTERLKVIRHCLNLGQGAALQTGITYALLHQKSWCVSFDADGQHSPTEIPSLLQPIWDGDANITFGSRFVRPADRKAIPVSRRMILLLGRIFNGLMTGIWMTDAHNGFRAFDQQAMHYLQLKENRMAYATELLWQLRKAKLNWKEVPVHITYSPYSLKKGQSSWQAVRIASDVVLRLIFRGS